MKPIIILPPGAMSEPNLKMLRDNGLCVVVAKDPAKVKFLDPIPAAASRTATENAAIKLSRKLLTAGFWKNDSNRQEIAVHYLDILLKGTPLDPEPSQEERERKAFDDSKLDEMRRLGVQEAREERTKVKQAKAKAEAEKSPA